MEDSDHSPFSGLDNIVPLGREGRDDSENVGIIAASIVQVVGQVIGKSSVDSSIGRSLGNDLWCM